MSVSSLVKEDLRAWQEGVRQFEDGDMDEAYQQFCDMTDQNSCIVFNLATVHLIIGNFQEAYGLYTEALEKDPYLVVGFYQRAIASHWMNKNEDALEDFTRALELMRESHVVDYSPLGMDLLLCSFQIHWCLAVVKSCLNLNDGARRSHAKAVQTKQILSNDSLDKKTADKIVKAPIPALSNVLVDPCMSGHRFGACPLINLNPPPIFKPRGVAKKILETDQNNKSQAVDGQTAKVLWYKDSSYNFTGFQGAKHKHELMPMFIRTGKKKKASKGMKEPPKAIAGLIKAATPQLVNLRPRSSSASQHLSPLARGPPSPNTPRQRRATMYAGDFDFPSTRHMSRSNPDLELELKLSRRQSTPVLPSVLVEDRLARPLLKSQSTSIISIPENEEGSDDDASTSDENHSLARRKQKTTKPSPLSIQSRSRSIEVLCQESPISPWLSREPSPDARSSASSPQPTSKHPSPNSSTIEINTHVAMTADNLRALADLLDKLQSSNGHKKVSVNVYFQKGAEEGQT